MLLHMFLGSTLTNGGWPLEPPVRHYELTLPAQNVPLAKRLNRSKDDGYDEGSAGALPAGVKQEAVRLVESGQSIAAGARTLGLVEFRPCTETSVLT
jgi:hypothetical protein